MRTTAIAGLLVIQMIVVACGSSEERAIRDRMSTIADVLTVQPNEGELARVARIARLRDVLAPGIQVSAGQSLRPGAQVPAEIAGREAVLALVGRWVPPPGGMTIEFVDAQVTLDDSRLTAQVYCTARVTSGPSERPNIDARELTVAFSKIDGAWVVTSVRPEDTLSR